MNVHSNFTITNFFFVTADASNLSPYTFSSLGKRIRHSFREKRRSLRLSGNARHKSDSSAGDCDECKQVNIEDQHLHAYRSFTHILCFKIKQRFIQYICYGICQLKVIGKVVLKCLEHILTIFMEFGWSCDCCKDGES